MSKLILPENPYLDAASIELSKPVRNHLREVISGDVTTPYASTYLGNRFYPRECRITKIDLEDIANGLAFQCRFNGQTSKFFSVAEHSLIVSALLPDRLKFAGLMHDAAEAYLGDWIKPLKILYPELNGIEHGVTELIAEHFGIDFSDYALIKRADLISLATEKRDLMPNSTENWSYLEEIPVLKNKLEPMDPDTAKAVFLDEFYRLDALRNPSIRNTKRRSP